MGQYTEEPGTPHQMPLHTFHSQPRPSLSLMASASVARNNGSSTVEDIEYLYTERPQAVTCQLCNRSLDHLTLEERADHYAVHFAQDEERTTGSISGLSRNNANGRSINLTGGGGEKGFRAVRRVIRHL